MIAPAMRLMSLRKLPFVRIGLAVIVGVFFMRTWRFKHTIEPVTPTTILLRKTTNGFWASHGKLGEALQRLARSAGVRISGDVAEVTNADIPFAYVGADFDVGYEIESLFNSSTFGYHASRWDAAYIVDANEITLISSEACTRMSEVRLYDIQDLLDELAVDGQRDIYWGNWRFRWQKKNQSFESNIRARALSQPSGILSTDANIEGTAAVRSLISQLYRRSCAVHYAGGYGHCRIIGSIHGKLIVYGPPCGHQEFEAILRWLRRHPDVSNLETCDYHTDAMSPEQVP